MNQLAQAMFSVYSRENDVEDRLKEFLALASSSLLRLGQENDKDTIKARESIYLLLHIIVKDSNVLALSIRFYVFLAVRIACHLCTISVLADIEYGLIGILLSLCPDTECIQCCHLQFCMNCLAKTFDQDNLLLTIQ